MRQHFDGPIGQISRLAADGEPGRLEPAAMAKIHALYFAEDQKAARDLVQFEPLSVRRGDRRLSVLTICIGEGGGRVTFGFHCRQAGSCEFLRLQVALGAPDGCLGGVEIGGGCRGRPGGTGSRNRLARVAHFLHGSASASDQADDTDKYSKEAQHRVL